MAVVQTIIGGGVTWNNHSSTTQDLTFASPVTAGNSVIVLTMGYFGGGFTMSSAPTDTAGNTYTIPPDSSSGQADSGTSPAFTRSIIYAAHAVNGGFTVVTLNGLVGAGVYGATTAIEVSGLAASPNDRAQGAGQLSPGSTDANVAIGGLAQADEFVVACMADSDDSDDNANITGPSGGPSGWSNIYRVQTGLSTAAASADYGTVSSSGGFTVQYAHDDLPGGNDWTIAVATFKLIPIDRPSFRRLRIRPRAFAPGIAR